MRLRATLAAVPGRRLGAVWVNVARRLAPFACSLPGAVVLASAFPAGAQQPEATAIVDRALQSGDGNTAESAYAVPGLLWEYAVLGRLGLRLRNQHATDGAATDVIVAHNPTTGQDQRVWFRSTVPQEPDRAEMDRVVRAMLTSGDGLSPETAFVVGGRIDAEYRIFRMMGIAQDVQALVNIRRCSFDRQSGRDVDTGERRDVYFKLGGTAFDYRGDCTLQPAPSPR